jgi:uncharacterized repeat protein (TIGR03803 family)
MKRFGIATSIPSLALPLLLTLFLATAEARIPQPQQLFAFSCNADSGNTCPRGGNPTALIQASDGNLYGAASVSALLGSAHGGSIFKVDAGGLFTLLFTFSPGRNGAFPNGSIPNALVEGKDGFLYGTALKGGVHNDGTLFKLNKDGSGFHVLHNFCGLANCSDGAAPISLLRAQDGSFYGATQAGPTDTQFCADTGCGTIFHFTTSGNVAIIHTFTGMNDGFHPSALIEGSDGNLYGTEMASGVMNGSVFSLTPLGSFSLVHTFTIYKAPLNGLVQTADGDLFGIFFDAAHSREQQLFKVSPSGGGYQEFPGFAPTAGAAVIPSLVLATDGNLWGVVYNGGTGKGSIIALSPQDGSVKRNISFNGSNGLAPAAPLLQAADRKIYGTTLLGGNVAQGTVPGGVVFRLNAGLSQ